MTDAGLHTNQRPLRILIGHLNANGDILYSSAVARQIKEVDYPSCHLTWAAGTSCARTLQLNPYIDEIREVPLQAGDDVTTVWKNFCLQARQQVVEGQFDLFIPMQLIGDNLLHFNKTLRLSTLELYLGKVTVPVEPVVRLSDIEVSNVQQFCELHQLSKYRKVVIFECAPLSGQSTVTPQFALEVVALVNQLVPDACFILSSYKAITGNAGNIMNASSLSFRENAELSRHCDLLIGCSSGITWLLTSDWAKPLPAIQLLNKKAVWFNSVAKDYDVRKKSSAHVLEIYDFDIATAAACIVDVLNNDFAKARETHHQPYSRYWCNTESTILFDLLKEKKIKPFFRFMHTTFKNNGYNVLFLAAVLRKLAGRCLSSIIK
jgi:hypothetical protein